MKTTEAFQKGLRAGRSSRLFLPFLPNPYSLEQVQECIDWHEGFSSERWLDDDSK